MTDDKFILIDFFTLQSKLFQHKYVQVENSRACFSKG